jgi:hypothetical protein
MMGNIVHRFNISGRLAMPETADEKRLATSVQHTDTPVRILSPAAQRALAEAAARRTEIEARVAAMPKEIGGRGGKEPVRYGDWEGKGIASDF